MWLSFTSHVVSRARLKNMCSFLWYKGSDDEEDVKTDSTHNENNNNSYNIVSNSQSDDKDKKNIFEEQVNDEIKVTPKTTLNPKLICAMKTLKVLCNENAKKTVEQATQEKSAKEFFFDWFSY